MRYLKMFKYPVHNNYVCISYPFIYSNSELFWHVAVSDIVTTGGASEQVQWRWCQTAGVWYDQEPLPSLWRIHHKATELLQIVGFI